MSVIIVLIHLLFLVGNTMNKKVGHQSLAFEREVRCIFDANELVLPFIHRGCAEMYPKDPDPQTYSLYQYILECTNDQLLSYEG